MRVLLSAYACEPGGGSETGKGWAFAEALARYGCEVTVLTCGSHHRERIESHCATQAIPPNLKFVWHDVPGWKGPGYENARYIRQHYMAWQITARSTARKLVRENHFDVIHHLTWTALRWPSFLGGLGPRFVFGPVGGGQVAPHLLRSSFSESERKRERLRDVINLVSRFDPMVLGCLSRADVILVTDLATKNHVPTRWHHKTFIVADIFAPEPRQSVQTLRSKHDGPRILFAGRLESWKGAQLALGALAEFRRQYPRARLSIAGSGPDEGILRRQVRNMRLDDATEFLGKVPHAHMSTLYAAHDVFLFPSLHDSGPHVIGEALAHGLPVVCLDLGGPGCAIDSTCGFVVQTGGLSVADVHARLASALASVVEDPRDFAELRRGAYSRAIRFSYPVRVADMVNRFYTPMCDQTPQRPNRSGAETCA